MIFGMGIASFGGCLLDKHRITLYFVPKDEHAVQIQFAMERVLTIFVVIETQKLVYPNDVYDFVHYARFRIHWDADGGGP